MKTVFHVTSGDPDDQASALRSVGNLLADDSVETEAVAVVANSSAVRLLTEGSPNAAEVRSLTEAGVGFRACSNTVRRTELSPEDLLDGVELVSSGVGELTRLQSSGYAYIRL